MLSYSDALENVHRNKKFRDFPPESDGRCNGSALFPHFEPKFSLKFNDATTVFTIGSCFARNIEEALETSGVNLPTRRFSVPKEEWPWRPNGLLNEFNPGTMRRRILSALSGERDKVETIVQSGELFVDLLLPGGGDVTRERAIERREEIFQVYRHLAVSQSAIITLGYVECWFDNETETYLNRIPPHVYAKANSSRFVFRRLDFVDSMRLLEEAIHSLTSRGVKIILTVSPVPLHTTFTQHDCVTANEFSKSVLRVCAQRLSENNPDVDYFPSYEIVRSSGISAYIEDNMHVREELVKQIVNYMVEIYSNA